MKSLEFECEVGPEGSIQIPREFAQSIPAGKRLHAVLGWELITDDEEEAWRALGRRTFEAAYAPEDSIYEQLLDDAPAR